MAQTNTTSSQIRQTEGPIDLAMREFKRVSELGQKQVDLAPEDRLKAVGISVGGQRYNIDQQGNLVDKSGGVADLSKLQQLTGDVSFIQSQFGKETEMALGNIQGVRAPIQQNVVAGANLGGFMTREQALEPLKTATQQTITPTLQGEISGADKLAKYKEAGIMTSGTGLSAPAGSAIQPTASIAGMGQINFADELNLNPNRPTKKDTETDEQFQIRDLTWKISNLSETYNAVVKTVTEQRLQSLLKDRKFLTDTTVPSFQSKVTELEENSAINNQFNSAMDFVDNSVEPLIEKKVRERMMGVTGSEAVRDEIRKTIEAEERKNAEEKARMVKTDLENAKEKAIEEQAKLEIQTIKSQIDKFSGMTPEEREKTEISDMVNEETAKIQANSPDVSFAEARSQAKRNINALLSASTPTEASITADLNEDFSDPTYAQKNAGKELEIAFNAFQDIDKAKEYAMKARIVSEADVNEQLVKMIKAKNPNKTEEEIRSAYIQTKTDANNQAGFLNGTLDEQTTLDYMANLEVDNPEKAKRLYQKALDLGVYDDNPAMKRNIQQGLQLLGGGDELESGNIMRDAESVMNGVLNLQDISVKDNYRAKVSSELRKRVDTAKESNDTEGIMKASAVFDKEPSDDFLKSMEKTITVLGQLSVLQENIAGMDTGPIVGAFKEKNAWDTQAQTIKAQLNAIVPNLARGVYGEVGVLTDNDIKTYSKTIPNLTSTNDVRDAVLYITVDMIKRNIDIKIKNQAAGQRDMSGYTETYQDVNTVADNILSEIGGTKQSERDDFETDKGFLDALQQESEKRGVKLTPTQKNYDIYLQKKKPMTGFRTDRHNNPTAFTTQIAEQAGLKEGIDYEVGDTFPNNPNFKTARLLGDPVETTIKVIDNIGFFTQGGQPRWTHTQMTPEQWNSLSYEQKRDIIKDMYQKEGNAGKLANFFNSNNA